MEVGGSAQLSALRLRLGSHPDSPLSSPACVPPSADRYLGLNWLKGEKQPVKLRRQAAGGEPAYLPDLFMLGERFPISRRPAACVRLEGWLPIRRFLIISQLTTFPKLDLLLLKP